MDAGSRTTTDVNEGNWKALICLYVDNVILMADDENDRSLN